MTASRSLAPFTAVALTWCVLTATALGQAKVVATVDGQPITQKDVDEVFESMAGESIKTATPEHIAQSKNESEPAIIEQLISKKLLAIAAKRQKIAETEVETALAEVKKHMGAKQLAEMKWTDAKLRAEITEDLKINKLIEERAALLPKITDDEIKKYYSAHLQEFSTPTFVEPRHILISTEGSIGADLRKKRIEAERLRIRLTKSKGADFSELAEQHSTCPSAKNGGVLGKIGKGQMPKPFEGVAFNQPVGEVSHVVETNLGFHIILVDRRHEASTLTLNEASPRIAQILLAQRKQKVMTDYVTLLRNKANIKRFK